MAIETRDDFDFRPDIAIEREPEIPEHSGLDILSAGFIMANPISGAVAATPRQAYDPEPGHDSLTAENLKGYEDHPELFMRSKSRAEDSEIKSEIDVTRAHRRILAESGTAGVLAEMAGAISNPFLWLTAPLGGPVTGAVATGLRMAGTAAIGEVMSETLLHSQQKIRTVEESAVNIVAGAATAGLLGGGMQAAAHAWSASERAALTKAIANDIDPNGPGPVAGSAAPPRPPPIDGVPARAWQPSDLPVPSRLDIPDVVADATSIGNPLGRMYKSSNEVVPSVAEDLVETIPGLRKNREAGLPTAQSVESQVRYDQSPAAQAMKYAREQFAESKGITGPGAYQRARLTGPVGEWEDFLARAGRAARVGDVTGDSYVDAVAKEWRGVTDKFTDAAAQRQLFAGQIDLKDEIVVLEKELAEQVERQAAGTKEPIARIKEAQTRVDAAENRLAKLEAQSRKSGLTDELTAKIAGQSEEIAALKKTLLETSDIKGQLAAKNKELAEWAGKNLKQKGGETYFSRVYDQNRVRATSAQFKAAIKDHYAGTGLDPKEAEKIAEHFYNSVTGKDKRFGMTGIPKRDILQTAAGPEGKLKARTDVPDKVLEPWLVDDIEHVGNMFSKQMSTEIRMVDKFGSRDMKEQLKLVKERGEERIRKAVAAGDNTKAAKLEKELASNLEDLAAMRDRLLGVYKTPDDPTAPITRAAKSMREFTQMLVLGAQTLSSIPDAARLIARNGFKPYLTALAHTLGAMDNIKMAKTDLEDIGLGLDMVTSGVSRAVGDLPEVYSAGKAMAARGGVAKVERFIEQGAGMTGKITLMDQWNAFFNQITGVLGVDRVARQGELAAEKGWNAIAAPQRLRLLHMGIDEAKLAKIHKQFQKHGLNDGRFRVANFSEWNEAEREIMGVAMGKEARSTITLPGVADKALWTSAPTGQMFGMFQSFIMSATNRILLANLAQRDANVAKSIVAAIGLGVFSRYIKEKIKSPDAKQTWLENPVKVFAAGLEGSGDLGYAARFVLPLATEKTFGGGLRRIGESITKAPAFGVLGKGATLIAAGVGALEGEPMEPLTRAMVNVTPWNTTWYVRLLADTLDDNTKQYFAEPKKEYK